MFKKTIKNIASIDFCNYTPEALKKIKKIINVSTIFLPENPSSDFMQTFAEIKLQNVAQTIPVPNNKIRCQVNGTEIITNCNSDNLYITNGIIIVASAVTDKPIQFISNGTVFYNSDVNIDFINLNGTSMPIDFDYKKAKLFNNKIEIDSAFIRNSETGTTVLCGNKIRIAPDVTEEQLIEKDFHFISCNKIFCKKDVYGYVAANSHVSNKIVTDDAKYQNWDKALV